MNISEWGTSKKLIAAVVLVLLLWVVYSTFFTPNSETQAILDLPEGTVTIVNDGGQEVTIDVKIGSSATRFKGVDPEVIQETVVYITTPFPASAERTFEPVKAPLQYARFGGDGQIQKIHDIPADTEKTITPEEKYQHTLIARDGFFAEHDISVDNGSTIQ